MAPRFALALLALLPFTSAELLASFDPTAKGASVRQIGSYNANACPVNYDNCTALSPAKPTPDQVFSVKNGRYNFYKPANYDRAEVHGITGNRFVEGKTYYLSWDFSVSDFPPAIDCADPYSACEVQSNRIFQFHTFGSPNTLNIPLQLFINNGSNQAIFYGMRFNNNRDASAGRNMLPLWTSAPLVRNTIYKIALMIHTSRQSSQGLVSLWWGGQAQVLAGGATTAAGPTWDGNSVDPKWGVYGAWKTELTTTIGKIRLGTTYKDVA